MSNTNDEIQAHRAAVARALAVLSEVYQNKFHVGAMSLDAWSDVLADLTPQEVLNAVRTWTTREKWPPSVAELRQMIPRFCRCGKCSACHRRAVERAMASGPGADLDTPVETIDDARRRFFAPTQPRALPPGSQSPQIEPRGGEPKRLL